jgi:hippurate hydrolase
VRDHLLAAIERITAAEAAAAGAPRSPTVTTSEGTPSTINDPALTKRLVTALSRALGADRIVEYSPPMGAEDFSHYGRAGVPAAIFWLGTVDPAKHAAAMAAGHTLPSLHSPQFAPQREPTLRTGVSMMAVAALELLGRAEAE